MAKGGDMINAEVRKQIDYAFEIYLNLGAVRSLKKTAAITDISLSTLEKWSRRYKWSKKIKEAQEIELENRTKLYAQEQGMEFKRQLEQYENIRRKVIERMRLAEESKDFKNLFEVLLGCNKEISNLLGITGIAPLTEVSQGDAEAEVVINIYPPKTRNEEEKEE